MSKLEEEDVVSQSGFHADKQDVPPKRGAIPPKQDILTKQEVVRANGSAGKVGIFLSLIAILIAAAAFGFSYLQLTKQNTALNEQVATLQQQTSNDTTQLRALAESVQQLQQVQQAHLRDNQDITALYMQLNAVNDLIDRLPLSPLPLQPVTEPAPVDETNMSWWQKGLNRSLHALNQIVIVRYNESKTPPLVLPEDRYFLYQNLHSEMANAMWAVLHRNQTVYQTSLARVAAWVQQYFVRQAPETINMMQALAALQIINIQPQDQQGT